MTPEECWMVIRVVLISGGKLVTGHRLFSSKILHSIKPAKLFIKDL